MGKVSLSLLAIVLGLVASIGGCAFGPDREASSAGLPISQVGQEVTLPNAADSDGAETYQRYRQQYAERPVVAPALGYEAEDESDGVVQVSGVFGEARGGNSISATLKNGVNKVAEILTPSVPVKPAEDPTSLTSKAKPSAGLYTAMGQLSEQSGRLPEAEKRYRQALQLEPQHPGALIAYARLKDRLGQLDEATRLYQQAVKAAPNDASVFNDLALCFARRRMLRESLAALQGAIRLQPKRALYRNNIATVLVEMGQIDAAFIHLRAVHREAIAWYNLGYLLQKKGESQAAERFFAKALEKDPSLAQAKVWIEKLGSPSPPDSQTAAQPAVDGPAENRSASNLSARVPPRRPVVPRLPPVPLEQVPEPTVSELRIPEVRQLPPVPKPVGGPDLTEDPPMPPPVNASGAGDTAAGNDHLELPRLPEAIPPDPSGAVPPMPLPALRVPSAPETGPAATPAPGLPPLVQPLPPVLDAPNRP